MLTEFIVEDISCGMESKRISFSNEVDDETLETNIKYTPFSIAGPGSSDEDFETVPQPCSCSDGCLNASCSCISCYGTSYINNILIEDYACNHGKPIIECSCLCTCGSMCTNRVTQYGIKYALQVFKTDKKGFGVKTLEHIPYLAFVCEYAGEVISKEEAKKRILSRNPTDANYIFVLREHSFEGKTIETVVDPTHVGNVGRYLNHSCSPNLIMVPVRVDNMIPKLCLFAARDLAPLEELCYDYGNKCVSSDGSTINLNKTETCFSTLEKECYCGSTLCVGHLPYDSSVLN